MDSKINNNKLKILAIIPARSGSKGIPNKNIKEFKGKPLICHSIECAKKSKYINNIIVSTDSEIIKNIALESGALVPFLRPLNISQDLSTDFEFMEHCLNFIIENDIENIPDIVVQLRPTYPLRKIETLEDCIEIFLNNYNEYDSLRTVYKLDKSPYKMYEKIEKNNKNYLIPLFKEVNGIKEPYNQCRQLLPDTYIHNGCIDIIKSNIILNYKSMSGDKIYPYIMNKEDNDDIDTIEQWKIAEEKLLN